MEEKNVDSVKKISKEELDKSRKIVLDAISDKRVAKKPDINEASGSLPAVDGVKKPFQKKKIINKILKKQEVVKSVQEIKLSKEERDKARDEINKIIPGQKEEIPEKKIISKPPSASSPRSDSPQQGSPQQSSGQAGQAGQAKEEIKLISKEPVIKLSKEKKKKWREELNRELVKGHDKKPESAKEPEQKLARKGKGKEIATDFLSAGKILDIRPKEEPKKKISRINPFNNELIASKIKSQETKDDSRPKAATMSKREKARLLKAEKKKKQKEKKQAKREKQREKKVEVKRQREIKKKERKEKIIKTKKWLQQSATIFSKEMFNVYKRTLMLGLFGVAAALLFYASLTIVIIEYNIDNKFTRQIARLIPIPAYVSKEGTVNYFTYRDIRAYLEQSGLKGEELIKATKVAVVEKIIIDNLARRYGLVPESVSIQQDDIRALLNERIVFDQNINQVGIKRIKKIKELIDQSGDFVKVANKYGDDQDQITLGPNDEEEYAYYGKVSSLSVGDVSQIITTSDGYYLFRCFDKKSDNLYLSFVYVRAKTLSEYIDESIVNYKLWSLVD